MKLFVFHCHVFIGFREANRCLNSRSGNSTATLAMEVSMDNVALYFLNFEILLFFTFVTAETVWPRGL